MAINHIMAVFGVFGFGITEADKKLHGALPKGGRRLLFAAFFFAAAFFCSASFAIGSPSSPSSADPEIPRFSARPEQQWWQW